MKANKSHESTPAISFEAKISNVNSWTLLTLPQSASVKLPSRGMVMVEGTINGVSFQAPLEPDGKKSHWLKVDKDMLKAVKADVGDTVVLKIAATKEWPEPEVPVDLKIALTAASQAHSLWSEITPMARWDWIRWIQATKNSETREKRIEVAMSKLTAGKRRPCCFNRTECMVQDVSHGGVLLASA